MEKVIILINAEDPEELEILTDERGCRLVFDSHQEAEDWLEENAEPGNSYMHWDGER